MVPFCNKEVNVWQFRIRIIAPHVMGRLPEAILKFSSELLAQEIADRGKQTQNQTGTNSNQRKQKNHQNPRRQIPRKSIHPRHSHSPFLFGAPAAGLATSPPNLCSATRLRLSRWEGRPPRPNPSPLALYRAITCDARSIAPLSSAGTSLVATALYGPSATV